MSTILRQSSALRAGARRAFSTTTAVRKDYVQDLYLKELKAYKAPPAVKDAHVGIVKTYSAPPTPNPPSVPSDLASELSKYDAQEPGHVDAPSSASASGHAAPGEDDVGKGAQAYLAFLESDPPKAEAHH